MSATGIIVKKYTDKINMMELLAELAPLHRTLANNDTDKALSIVAEVLPGSKIDGYPTGTPIWSWKVPRRWELRTATIKTADGVLVDAAWNILHVINYSQPFKGTVSRDELLKHIRTFPDRPDAIPFSFNFYESVWGFSIPHSWLERFTADYYEVEIDVDFEEGELKTLALTIPGEFKETFVICSNICHPGQVNDSLTGLAVAADIAQRLLAQNSRKYSYLVLVVPETIGSIAFLSSHSEIINDCIGGLFSEMLGTDGPLVGQRTRGCTGYWDTILADVLGNSGLPSKMLDFMKSASNDEKVLDSPGVDIPTFALTRYPYPEYHTSDDNIDLIDLNRLREARDILQSVIDIAEADFIPVLNQPGPIFLSGYDLYPDWRSDPSLLPVWQAYVDVMYSIDGVHSVVELAAKHNISLAHYFYWTNAFADKGLLTKKSFVLRRPSN